MAKKRILEVPRDGSDADFVPENYMLIDGAEGSAKMRMDLFGKASAVEELDDVKYEKPEGGIPKGDLSESVQGSLGLADSALQASDIEGKADKSEMLINEVSGDETKKTIQLKSGLSQDVVIDVSGKADATDVLTSWQPVASAPMTGKLEFYSTRYPTRTEIMLKDATRPGGTVAEDVVVGYTVPNIESGNVGKCLMVDSQLGTSWQSVEHTLSYPSATEGEYSTLRGIISFQTDNTPRRTSAYLAVSDHEPTCLGMFVPPVKREDVGRILIVDENEGPVWRDPPSTDPEITWQYGDDESRYGTLSVGTTLEYDSEEQAYPHHSSAYIEYNGSSTWLGAFVPPTDIGDSGKVLMVDQSKGVEWKSPSELRNYNAGTGITIGYSDNSINVSHPLPAVTPGADKILSTDANGNLTWMPKYTGSNYGIKVDPTSNVISRGYQVIDTRVYETLSGATLNDASSIKYSYKYSIPLDWTAGPFGYMIVDWAVVCKNGRKNNPFIGVGFSKKIGDGWNATWGLNVEVPGIIMQDSVNSWRAESRAIGHFTHYGLDFDTLQINIYADDGVFTSTDEVNVELSIMMIGYYSRESQANT